MYTASRVAPCFSAVKRKRRQCKCQSVSHGSPSLKWDALQQNVTRTSCPWPKVMRVLKKKI